tara:strand:+ start:263 stop:2704 length:2442 start_codon:yes stop_codon:yes gene_type:complete
MSFRHDNVENQTAFRLAALSNGYTPLPNHDKKCFVKGWNTLQPTPEMIEGWSRKLVYQATGLRVENGMCAIDIDIDDAVMVERIWERAAGQFPQLREALIRYGSGAKEMWVCRTDEPFSVIFSTSHVKPGHDPENDDVPAYRLEAFGGGHPRQIGSFGAHTMKSDGSGFVVEYTWADDESPAEVALSALPLLPKSAVLAIAQIASDELAAADWPRIKRSRSGESALTSTYDLLPDMRFACLDGQTRSLDQLAGYATTDRNARCSASWTGDPTMVNRTRCLISIDHEGVVSVLETANWTRHLPADKADSERTLAERTEDLRQKMEEVGFEFDFDTYHDAPPSFQDVVFKLLEDWAWCGPRSSPCLPIYRDEELAMSYANLKITNLQYAYEREGPKGGIQKVSPVDAWISHSQRQDVDGYRFMPQHPQGIFAIDGVRAINSYVAPVHEIVPDGAERDEHIELWEDFLVHLLPDDEEREWFCDWLAHKKQNLTVPAVGVIMYAAPFGVGRGSLFELISAIFGDRYVNNVGADVLLGSSAQAQYTDWMANTLIITTDEVLPDGEEGTSMAWRRKKAYEKLKERVDPKPRRMNIVRKTLPNYQDWVYTSFLLATNHNNAIPIPVDDRRMVVLTNGIVPLADNPDLMVRLNRQRNPNLNLRFIGSLAAWLDERDVTRFNAHVAPNFKGKSRMQDANISEIEGIIDDVLEAMPFEWATLDTILDRVENSLTRMGMRDDYPHWRKTATDRAKHQWSFFTRAYLDRARQIKRTILIHNPAGGEKFKALSTDEKIAAYAELKKLDNTATDRVRALRAGLRVVR